MLLPSLLLAAGLTHVPSAQQKIAGASAPNELSPELRETVVVQGSHRVENPLLAGGLMVSHYGYHADGPLLPAPGDLPSPTHRVEATKTEPDKNTYLVLRGQRGADPSYDYGHRFLFQGHENGARSTADASVGAITRVNLDADGAHRVTVLSATDVKGTPLPVFDGSTWDPWAKRLLFTAEGANGGGVWQATLDVPSAVEPLTGILGQGGYEGVQNDSDGNLWIVEDSGGSTAPTAPHARQPNSFVFRFVPANPRDLKQGGRLQALQVLSQRGGQPIVFHPGQAAADIFSDDVKDLHTCALHFRTRWVTVHDTASDGDAPFNANAAAKAASATPFKRPENGVFRPGSRFREFFFTETGDTNALTEAGAAFGGFGGIFRLSQRGPSEDEGGLTIFFVGDVAHTGLDNIAFWDRDHLVAV
ncbi:MAG: alkaline phosphatase PhoX, partial [Myxococcales bacterium]